MTYRYAVEPEDDLPPIAAICDGDDCGCEIPDDLWEECEVRTVHGIEHLCPDCEALPSDEEEFRRSDNRARYENIKGEL